MEIKAKANFVRMSPRKVRLVANLIKGLSVEEAATQLQFNVKAAALPLAKLLKSAVSNAEENHKLKRNNLFIKALMVNEGPVLKRWAPKAFGRATPIRKPSCHITIVLAELVPTQTKAETKNKKSKNDDIVKVDDFEAVKQAGKEQDKEEEPGQKSFQKTSKGFAKKVFSRKSGQK